MSMLKRSFDIVFALILGILFMPVFVVIAVVLKVTSPGPVFFRQERLGRGGATFTMAKFRKFPADWGAQGPGVTLQFDSRMTKIGRFLERTKLDELPQLWNILIGEMSFVGPRPESLRFKSLFTDEYKEVLSYTPGIFGPNQTKYRNESAMYPADEDPQAFYERVLFPDKARNDLEYFKEATFLTDLRCIAGGVFALIFNMVIWRKSMRLGAVLIVWDIACVLGAWMAAHWLKYSVTAFSYSEAPIKPGAVAVFKAGFVVVPIVMVLVFLVVRVYRHPARYFSGTDFYRLAGACCATWLISAFVFGLTLSVRHSTSLMLAVVCLISICLMALPRVLYKEWHALNAQGRLKPSRDSRINIVVYGISDQSVALCNLLNDGFSTVRLVGIVAEESKHLRKEVHGFQVLGMVSDLDVLNARYKLNQIWIASEIEVEVREKIDKWCIRNQASLFTLGNLPGFRSLSLKQTAIEDSYSVPGMGGDTAPLSENKKNTVVA